jgi:hypothetical protein
MAIGLKQTRHVYTTILFAAISILITVLILLTVVTTSNGRHPALESADEAKEMHLCLSSDKKCTTNVFWWPSLACAAAIIATAVRGERPPHIGEAIGLIIVALFGVILLTTVPDPFEGHSCDGRSVVVWTTAIEYAAAVVVAGMLLYRKAQYGPAVCTVVLFCTLTWFRRHTTCVPYHEAKLFGKMSPYILTSAALACVIALGVGWAFGGVPREKKTWTLLTNHF